MGKSESVVMSCNRPIALGDYFRLATGRNVFVFWQLLFVESKKVPCLVVEREILNVRPQTLQVWNHTACKIHYWRSQH
jgi:hypothetical protein